MYFAVLGKNINISLKELELVSPSDIKFVSEEVVKFQALRPDILQSLGGIVKRGRVVPYNEVEAALEKGDFSILGVDQKSFGTYLKKNTDKITRFKIVEYRKTDLDIKTRGAEIYCFDDFQYLDLEKADFFLVEGYQDIGIYESIDFDKPVRSMKVGIMPAKFAHIILNIGIAELNVSEDQEITLYDPFVGSGTIGFVANYLGYNFIGSDINTSPVKQNLKWWQNFAGNDKKYTVFKHNIKEKIKNRIVKNADLVVTEGRLGPIVKKNSSQEKLVENKEEIVFMYKSFLQGLDDFFDNIVAVFTVPVYKGEHDDITSSLEEFMKLMGWTRESLQEVYMRRGQNVGRRIIIGKKN